MRRCDKLLTRRSFVHAAAVGGAAVALGATGCSTPTATEIPSRESLNLPSQTPENPPVSSAPDQDTLPQEPEPTSLFPAHGPLGQGRGVLPGRVAWVRDGAAVSWDGAGHWWQDGNFNLDVVLAMTREAVALCAGAATASEGWRALFAHHNQEHGRTGGYEPGQSVAIKCNMNGAGTYGQDEPSDLSYTAPSALRALLTSLVEDAGVDPSLITVADPSRIFPAAFKEFCSDGTLSGVRFSHYAPHSDEDAEFDPAAPLTWSGSVAGEPSFAPACFSQADYLINLASLKGHEWGITLSAKNHYGSVMNSDRLRPPQTAGLHPFVSSPSENAYTPLVDLLGNAYLDGKCVLWMLDGLLVSENNAAAVTREGSLWEGEPFNGGFTASIFASQDPVALDSVGADFLASQPTVTTGNPVLASKPAVEAYLHEAAQANKAPSGTTYQDGLGNPLESLGVHEHWNNSTARLYSRDRGEAEGIELARILR